jgi:pilus assembly protein FimV
MTPLNLTEEPVVEAAQPVADGGMDFVLDFPIEETAKAAPASVDMNLSDINLNLDDVVSAPAAEVEHDEHWHEVATKLDLAKAYQEMGDAVGAREILDEVLQEGDEQQREAAQSLIAQL